jgi:ArsR family transcriptional regulator, arsenate/arsenite/antimonite-responsive transcriptional repressor
MAYDAGCLEDDDPGGLFRVLTTASTLPLRRHGLMDAPPVERRAIRRRLRRLHHDVRLRRAYRDILAALWRVAEPRWTKFGREAAGRTSSAWARRLRHIDDADALTALIPPRHPLVRPDDSGAELLRRRRRFTIVPVYFCMSGGQLADLDSDVHVGVPANPVEPIRRTRDALFVSDRARVLAEPTRVRILIHLLSNPAGVMQMTRALGLAQPTVSEHVRVLTRAGLVVRRRRASGAVYTATWTRAGRLVEDIRASLARWSS